MVTDVFEEHGLRGQNDRLIDVPDMVVVLSTLYSRISKASEGASGLNVGLTADLCLNWLLNVYDSQRTGQMRVLSFRVALVCLCRGQLEDKYRCESRQSDFALIRCYLIGYIYMQYVSFL